MPAIAYDRRGFGRSDHAATGYDYDTFADDLADLIAELRLDADIGLAGFSMGGGEIARYMSRHGGKGVSAAALISSVVPYMLKTDDNPDGVPQSAFDEMTLVVHGTADKTVPIDATSRAVAKAVPGAKLIEYDGEPHAVFATQMERLSKDLVDFFKAN